ncbi:DNA (CYTOSINE-5)-METHYLTRANSFERASE CMT3 [Salix koriyanagi]|uniref:DNA (CYTOSINE-5)-METHYLTRANSFERASE CMT3 n=1 Tax=Salix koriyanagi TaxID=2511006 RepID=A0A9Q0SYZ8_9ROSI|nr:DNA (CYTOSINE-5)-METHYLTRANSFERASE CMT3 [Salix koriyanagi]
MGRKFWVMVGPEQEEHGRVVVRTVQAFEPWSYGSVKEDETPARFVGVQVPGAEAERSGLIDMLLRCHYTRAEVDGIIDAHVKASDGEPDYIWRIIEMFESKESVASIDFRNTKNPSDDPKNKQLIVFMDPVDFIRPKLDWVCWLVGLTVFCGFVYGFLWGACATEVLQKLPQYPLPTHGVRLQFG